LPEAAFALIIKYLGYGFSRFFYDQTVNIQRGISRVFRNDPRGSRFPRARHTN
jgi:hypothetical protein